jgi:hypothetical protein
MVSIIIKTNDTMSEISIINFMYRNPNNKKAREKIIGVWVAEASDNSRFIHLLNCWQKFCENNILDDDDEYGYDEYEFIEKFMDEFFEDPLNSDFSFQGAVYYNLTST